MNVEKPSQNKEEEMKQKEGRSVLPVIDAR
jgi:hypothetical protein